MYCKLTNQNLQTHNGFQWVIGEWKETSGWGPLCTNGWLHAYTHPLLAMFLNTIHADIQNPRLFEIEVAGKIQEDYGLKVGFTKMRLIKEIPLPKVTSMQRIVFAVLCAKEVETNEEWQKWADNWLNNNNAPIDYSIYCHASTSATHHAVHAVYYAVHAVYHAHGSTVCPANAVYYAAQAAAAAILSKPLNLIEVAEKALTYN